MRHHRVRFTPPRVERSSKRSAGSVVYLHSAAGRRAKEEKKWEQWRHQNGKCPHCPDPLSLTDAKFESEVFSEDVENRLVHKACARLLSKSSASSQPSSA